MFASSLVWKRTAIRASIRITKSTLLSILALLLVTCSFQLIIAPQAEAAQKEQAQYVCPMHADVKSAKPAKCPKCGMHLRVASSEPKTPDSTAGSEKPADKQESATVEIPDVNVV